LKTIPYGKSELEGTGTSAHLENPKSILLSLNTEHTSILNRAFKY
jgi:hypothetical protein